MYFISTLFTRKKKRISPAIPPLPPHFTNNLGLWNFQNVLSPYFRTDVLGSQTTVVGNGSGMCRLKGLNSLLKLRQPFTFGCS